jgi:hypothetical protein
MMHDILHEATRCEHRENWMHLGPSWVSVIKGYTRLSWLTYILQRQLELDHNNGDCLGKRVFMPLSM